MSGQTYTLQSSISSTQTTITLTSFTVPVTGDPITMVLMNTDIAYGTIAPKTSQSELISFTGVTQNSDGTATLTGVTRGLNKTYPLTESTDFKLPHSGQSTFILSDAPQVLGSYGAKDNDEVITGYWEVPDPLTAQGIASKNYVDNLVNGGTVSVNRMVVAGLAGETLAAGNSVYYKASDGRWWKTDADDATITYGVVLGIAQGSGTAGNNITGGVLVEGIDLNNTGTAGSTMYISNTAGALSTSVGTNTRAIGQYLPSSGGLLFDTNKYVKYPQNVQSTFATDSVGTDSYAITLVPSPGAYTDGMMVSFKAGTANTGACTLDVNGLGAKTIKKFGTYDTVTGDIVSGQDVVVIYDGTNFQLQTPTPYKSPVTTVYTTTGTQLGSSTTRFDITNTSGSTYRYTFDGTGTDPNFSAVNNPVGSLIYFNCQNFNSANNGLFLVTGSGSNYVEVTNASGVAEVDKTVGTGNLQRQTAASGTYTKSSDCKYIIVEQVGGGGDGVTGGNTTSNAGGSSGGYAKKQIAASSLSASEYFIVGAKLNDTQFRLTGSSPIATIGARASSGTTPGTAGTATGGDINITGGYAAGGISNTGSGSATLGGSNPLGIGGGSTTNNVGTNGSGYGSGGGGGGTNGSVGQTAGTGAQGVVIITEYFV